MYYAAYAFAEIDYGTVLLHISCEGSPRLKMSIPADDRCFCVHISIAE